MDIWLDCTCQQPRLYCNFIASSSTSARLTYMECLLAHKYNIKGLSLFLSASAPSPKRPQTNKEQQQQKNALALPVIGFTQRLISMTWPRQPHASVSLKPSFWLDTIDSKAPIFKCRRIIFDLANIFLSRVGKRWSLRGNPWGGWRSGSCLGILPPQRVGVSSKQGHGRKACGEHFDSKDFSYLKNSGSSKSTHKPNYLLIFHYTNLIDLLIFL